MAQEHLPLRLVESTFAQAVCCAEAIGIFQWHRLQNQAAPGEFEEYRNIAHCLYILDKQISATTGVSPRIPRLEFQLDLNLSLDGPCKALWMEAELAAIEETVLVDIYAGQVVHRSEDGVRQTVAHIYQRLTDWLAKSGIDADLVKRQPESRPAQAALLFKYLCTKLLLIWPYREHRDALFQDRLGDSETCLRILLSLWSCPVDPKHHMSIPL